MINFILQTENLIYFGLIAVIEIKHGMKVTTEVETHCGLRRNIIFFMLDGLIDTRMDSY